MNEGGIELGSLVVDLITGFSGIATSRCESIYQVPRVGVTAEQLVDGKPIEEQWFPEATLRVIRLGELERQSDDFDRTHAPLAPPTI